MRSFTSNGELPCIKGRKAHDVKLIALMQAKGITHLVTFNVADFKGYSGITPIHPVDVS